jgi:hypothetical protein
LISNCIEGHAGSVEIALDKQSKEIIFKIEAKTDNVSNFVEIRQPYKVCIVSYDLIFYFLLITKIILY